MSTSRSGAQKHTVKRNMGATQMSTPITVKSSVIFISPFIEHQTAIPANTPIFAVTLRVIVLAFEAAFPIRAHAVFVELMDVWRLWHHPRRNLVKVCFKFHRAPFLISLRRSGSPGPFRLYGLIRQAGVTRSTFATSRTPRTTSLALFSYAHEAP